MRLATRRGNERAPSLSSFRRSGRSRNHRGWLRNGQLDDARTLIPQCLLKLGRVEDERPPGGAQAVNRLIGQSERGRQLIEVVALGLVLQRLERHVDHIDVSVWYIHDFLHSRVFVFSRTKSATNLA